VPELSRFFGIVIAMCYNDHAPPHFHAHYGDSETTIRIDSGGVLQGSLSTRAQRLIDEWRILHQTELEEDWSRARARQP
jgi:hypothetical protein